MPDESRVMDQSALNFPDEPPSGMMDLSSLKVPAVGPEASRDVIAPSDQTLASANENYPGTPPRNTLEGEFGRKTEAGPDTALQSESRADASIRLFQSFLRNLDSAALNQSPLAIQARDLTNRMIDEKIRSLLAANNSVPSKVGSALDENPNRNASPPAPQKEKPEDSWFWQALESSGTLKPQALKIREYVESPTDTKGLWDWLTNTIPKSTTQLGVGIAKGPSDLAQTYSNESQAAVEKFLREHPEYEQLIQDDPTGQSTLELVSAIGGSAGIVKTAEAAGLGFLDSVGKPVGIDIRKQTWSWDTFKDAWVNHPVESFAAVLPFGLAFLKRMGVTPHEAQVRELVNSAVKDEKTPLARELKDELEQGPPNKEFDFIEKWEDSSKSGIEPYVSEGTGTYENVGGHHVYAKSGFRGHPEYDPQKGFSISQEFMESQDWSHGHMTSDQRRLFDELAASGRPNSLAEHTRIAVEALMAGGATEAEARAIVAHALSDLRSQGIVAPTRIPWRSDK